MQARLALEHGKRLFLIKSLVLHEEWAQKYAQRPGALVVEDVDDVMGVLGLKASRSPSCSFWAACRADGPRRRASACGHLHDGPADRRRRVPVVPRVSESRLVGVL